MGMNYRGRVTRHCLTGLFALVLSACGGSDDAADDEASADTTALSKMLVDNTAGKACDSDKACGNGICQREVPEFPSLGFSANPAPGGFCSFACRLNVDCGKGGVCIGVGSNAFGFNHPDERGLCMKYCDTDSECREGYTCQDLFGQPPDAENSAALTGGSCQPPRSGDQTLEPPP